MSKTKAFGTPKREGHDSSAFYARNLYNKVADSPTLHGNGQHKIEIPPLESWADQIYQGSSENMESIPDNSVALAFTSPPYNVGKDYDDNMDLDEYLNLIRRVAQDVYRVLLPGGRYVINIANLGRKPYIPLHAHFYKIHDDVGFKTMGEIIWRKSKGSNGSCAWGSWQSAKAPRLRDVHEYLLVFAKEFFSRPDKGESTIQPDEFMAATLSVWEIPPESAKRVGHPAPFPVELASRVIKLYSYANDVVLDPFLGSGTTCVAACQLDRHYVGYDLSKEYCAIANKRLVQSLNEKLSNKQNLSQSDISPEQTP